MPSGECSPLKSPRQGCADCLSTACPEEAEACKDSDCSCGNSGDSLGEMNCLLACPTLTPRIEDVDNCGRGCGFSRLGMADPRTKALFDCLVNPPAGPPLCEACF
jgi:hypothetical protein